MIVIIPETISALSTNEEATLYSESIGMDAHENWPLIYDLCLICAIYAICAICVIGAICVSGRIPEAKSVFIYQ